jgi:hypothetical protein
MKYMIMMFGEAATMMETRSPEWIDEMMAFMFQIDKDLRESGELVFQLGLADGSTAKLVTVEGGAPAVTDGSFAPSKESLIGYWVVDVAGEARAIEIASQIAGVTGGPVEVRLSPEPPAPE